MKIKIVNIFFVYLTLFKSVSTEDDAYDCLDSNLCSIVSNWKDKTSETVLEYMHPYFLTAFNSNLQSTPENKAEALKAKNEYGKIFAEKQKEADKIFVCKTEVSECPDTTLIGVLERMNTEKNKLLSEDERSQQTNLEEKITNFFSEPVEIDGVSYNIGDTMRTYMLKRDYQKLLKGWQQYHDIDTQKDLKENFLKLLKLKQKKATINGYEDLSKKWFYDEFEDTTMELNMDQLLLDVFPLYKRLHAYVRSKLFDFYLPQVQDEKTKVYLQDKNNAIPAHILGDMWAQTWTSINNLVIPFPKQNPIKLEQILKDKNYNPMKMFKMVEEFYTSLGFNNMTDIFWEKSVFTRVNNDMNCVPAVYDIISKDDYRILMCTEMNDIGFYAVHHTMNAVVIYMLTHTNYFTYWDHTSRAFSSGIADAILLSAKSRKHLEAINFVTTTSTSKEDLKEQRINDQMQTAMQVVSFIPFMYSVEKWRFGLFKGEFKEDEFNKQWWKIRQKFNGISPPVARPDAGFDAGLKIQVALINPYFYFIYSFVGQFQFNEALCKEAGQTEDYSNCDIYNSKEAGDKLKRFMSPGSSIPWKELMMEFTGENNFNSKAILGYFKVLDDYLKDYLKTNNIPIGWEGMMDDSE